MNNCNLTTCRYNNRNHCNNAETRTECIEVSQKVLCLGEKTFRQVDDVKHIGNDDDEPIETTALQFDELRIKY